MMPNCLDHAVRSGAPASSWTAFPASSRSTIDPGHSVVSDRTNDTGLRAIQLGLEETLRLETKEPFPIRYAPVPFFRIGQFLAESGVLLR